MSYSLNSLKGDYIGEYCRVIKGVTRSLDMAIVYSQDAARCWGSGIVMMLASP